MKKRLLQVSDHALVRYMERVLGHDLDVLRDEIAERVEAGAELGAEAVIIDGFRYALQGKCVVTIYSATAPSIRTGCVKDKRRMPDRV